jgi:hypothetical protein
MARGISFRVDGTKGGKGQNGIDEFSEHKDGMYDGFALIEIF